MQGFADPSAAMSPINGASSSAGSNSGQIAERNEILYNLNVAFHFPAHRCGSAPSVAGSRSFGNAHARDDRAVGVSFPLPRTSSWAFAEDQHKRRREFF